VTEFPVCGYCGPWGITVGAEGDIWFTLPVAGEVGRITPSGLVTRFPLPVGPNEPRQIALGSDGNLWVADVGVVREEPSSGQILRVTPVGEVTKFSVPTPVENFRPTAIAPGPDGALWFTGSGTGVGRIDASGSIAEFPLWLFGERNTIVGGHDGNIWFSNGSFDGTVDRLTTSGRLTTYPVPDGSRGITVGPDGNIWFTEWAGHSIGRIVPGVPGLEVSSARTRLRGGRAQLSARLALFCSGGSAGSRCAGTVVLRAKVKIGSGRSAERRRIELGSARYGLADDSGAAVRLTLGRRRLKLLPRGHEVRVEAVANATAGVGTSRPLLLAFPGRR
jgi:streptogramin lyase